MSPTNRRQHRPAERGVAAVALFVGLSVVSVSSAAHPASARSDQATHGTACASPSGVTVVIDFNGLGGGGVDLACAPDDPADGFEALHQAGVAYRTTTQFPDMLCQIAGLPSDTNCYRAVPADRYWSYWYKLPGGRWTYSSVGARSRKPPPGSLEGWSFFARSDSQTTAQPPRYTAKPPAPPATTTPPTSPQTIPPTVAPTVPQRPGGGGTPPPVDPTGNTTSPAAGPAVAPGTDTTATTEPASGTTAEHGVAHGAAGNTDGVDGSGTARAAGDRAAAPSAIDLSDAGHASGSPLPAIAVGTVLVAVAAWRLSVVVRRRRLGTSTGP